MNWTIHSASRLGELTPAWNRLNDVAGGLPFLHSRFIEPLCEVFGGPELRIAACEDAAGQVALGIFGRRGTFQWQTFQPSQLPLGAWVMRPGANQGELLSGLVRALPGLTLAVGLTQQDPDRSPRPADSSLMQTLDYIQTAHLPISGSFDEYWNGRGKNLRQNMRKQRARLEKEGIATRLEILTRPEDVAGAIADYGALESAGWKAAGGTAIHPDNAQGRFYRAMLESFCRVGAGRIYRYRFGERVVAVDLCIEGGGALVILKTTYDESIRTVSPAFLMREESLRLIFEEQRFDRVEFFGKLMNWHTRWSDDVRTLYHANFYRSSLVPRLRALARRFARRQHDEDVVPAEDIARSRNRTGEGGP
jgi:CelD/BcsL family acetyltransferase involved in cellulose biosynthesis